MRQYISLSSWLSKRLSKNTMRRNITNDKRETGQMTQTVMSIIQLSSSAAVIAAAVIAVRIIIKRKS